MEVMPHTCMTGSKLKRNVLKDVDVNVSNGIQSDLESCDRSPAPDVFCSFHEAQNFMIEAYQ